MKDGVTEHRTRRRVAPPSQIRSLFPILKNPANRHRAVGFTKEQFHDAFANTVSREESDAAYDLLHFPAPGNWVWAPRTRPGMCRRDDGFARRVRRRSPRR